ncbi:MAG: hypothetical protein ABL890_01900 [Candidatus Peribacteraceae bacterium]
MHTTKLIDLLLIIAAMVVLVSLNTYAFLFNTSGHTGFDLQLLYWIFAIIIAVAALRAINKKVLLSWLALILGVIGLINVYAIQKTGVLIEYEDWLAHDMNLGINKTYKQQSSASSVSATLSESSVVIEQKRALPFVEVVLNIEESDNWYSDVYYTNKDGVRRLIAESKEGVRKEEGHLPTGTTRYTDAVLSPNGRYIAMPFDCWEIACLHVYDLETSKMYESNTGNDTVTWLPDGRLEFTRSCQPMRECGVWRSVSSQTPWLIEAQKE